MCDSFNQEHRNSASPLRDIRQMLSSLWGSISLSAKWEQWYYLPTELLCRLSETITINCLAQCQQKQILINEALNDFNSIVVGREIGNWNLLNSSCSTSDYLTQLSILSQVSPLLLSSFSRWKNSSLIMCWLTSKVKIWNQVCVIVRQIWTDQSKQTGLWGVGIAGTLKSPGPSEAGCTIENSMMVKMF